MNSAPNSDGKGESQPPQNGQDPAMARLLRHGLARQQTALESHPDPDLLAAFAERTLTKREHAVIFEHLAACSLCREVVALSAPEAEDTPASAKIKAKPAGFFIRWSWVPLSACAAALLVALGITVLHPALEKHTAGSAIHSVVPNQPTAPPAANQTDDAANLQSGSREIIAGINNVPESRQETASAKSPAQRSKQIIANEKAGQPVVNLGLARGQSYDAHTASSAPGVGGLLKNKENLDDASRSDKIMASASDTLNTTNNSQVMPAPVPMQVMNGAGGAATGNAANANSELSKDFSRLPHEEAEASNQKRKVRSVQQQGPSLTAQQLIPLDEEDRRVVINNNASRSNIPDRDANGNATIASARPEPTLAFATGTPLWQMHNGQVAEKKAANEQQMQAASSVQLTQNAVARNLPANTTAVKVAQVGTVLFVVTQSGALLVSKNDGGTWNTVAGPWQGQVVNIKLLGTVAQVETLAAQSNTGQTANYASNQAPLTDTWVSADQGASWTQIKK